MKDKEVRKQINLKWEADFQKFEQSIDATHKDLKSSLSGQNFSVYPIKDNGFNIRFESAEEPVKISDILRASNEGEVYHISLGENSKITARREKGNERHYDFTGSGSYEMTINWQAEDSKGNSMDSSMTIEVGSDGIQKVIGEPKFGGLKFTSSLSEEEGGKILKLVKQNKEVFINGKPLLEAFIGMGKNVSYQPTQEEETFIRNPPGHHNRLHVAVGIFLLAHLLHVEILFLVLVSLVVKIKYLKVIRFVVKKSTDRKKMQS